MTIELHLTYRCNLSCLYCNRGCSIRQDHTPDMTIDQVEWVLTTAPKPITKIVLIGGEPTLHPCIVPIAIRCRAVTFFVAGQTFPACVQVYSNAFTGKSRAILKQLEAWGVVVFSGTYKDTSIEHGMQSMFISPADLGIKRTTPCSWSAGAGGCGYSVDACGISPCACGGAIDGILKLGVRTWNWHEAAHRDRLLQLCRHCGSNLNFKDDTVRRLQTFRGQKMSSTWISAAHRK